MAGGTTDQGRDRDAAPVPARGCLPHRRGVSRRTDRLLAGSDAVAVHPRRCRGVPRGSDDPARERFGHVLGSRRTADRRAHCKHLAVRPQARPGSRDRLLDPSGVARQGRDDQRLRARRASRFHTRGTGRAGVATADRLRGRGQQRLSSSHRGERVRAGRSGAAGHPSARRPPCRHGVLRPSPGGLPVARRRSLLSAPLGAPTRLAARYPYPALNTTEPSQAPTPLAMFSAEWFSAAPSICASPAVCMRRICKLIASSELTTPRPRTSKAAGTAYGERKKTSTRTTMLPTNPPSTERLTSQSTRRPATHVPITDPRPKASRNIGIVARDRLATSVTIGAM